MGIERGESDAAGRSLLPRPHRWWLVAQPDQPAGGRGGITCGHRTARRLSRRFNPWSPQSKPSRRCCGPRGSGGRMPRLGLACSRDVEPGDVRLSLPISG
jgi:hypothetical protein